MDKLKLYWDHLDIISSDLKKCPKIYILEKKDSFSRREYEMIGVQGKSTSHRMLYLRHLADSISHVIRNTYPDDGTLEKHLTWHEPGLLEPYWKFMLEYILDRLPHWENVWKQLVAEAEEEDRKLQEFYRKISEEAKASEERIKRIVEENRELYLWFQGLPKEKQRQLLYELDPIWSCDGKLSEDHFVAHLEEIKKMREENR